MLLAVVLNQPDTSTHHQSDFQFVKEIIVLYGINGSQDIS